MVGFCANKGIMENQEIEKYQRDYKNVKIEESLHYLLKVEAVHKMRSISDLASEIIKKHFEKKIKKQLKNENNNQRKNHNN